MTDFWIAIAISRLMQRKAQTWEMVRQFYEMRDSHGVHDMAVEVQAIERAIELLRHDQEVA